MADKLSPKSLSKMKVADLKKALKARGLTVTGSKNELVERLEGYIKENGEDTGKSQEEALIEEVVDDPNEDEVLGEDSLEEDATLQDSAVELTSPEQPEISTNTSEPNKEFPDESDDKISETISPEAKVVTLKNVQTLSLAERKEMRAARFSPLMSEDQKKVARAERFGLSNNKSSVLSNIKVATLPELDKLKKRAERFGSISPKIQKVEEAEKLRKRKERFGISSTVTTAITAKSDESEVKKLKRAERFGLA